MEIKPKSPRSRKTAASRVTRPKKIQAPRAARARVRLAEVEAELVPVSAVETAAATETETVTASETVTAAETAAETAAVPAPAPAPAPAPEAEPAFIPPTLLVTARPSRMPPPQPWLPVSPRQMLGRFVRRLRRTWQPRIARILRIWPTRTSSVSTGMPRTTRR